MLNQVQYDNIRKGFTLAEVLVVITIIGVIASLTIPDLITSVQEVQYISAWKKNFNQLSAATAMMKEDNGGTLVNIFANNGLDHQLGFATIYSRYLTTIKNCNTWGTSGDCWHEDFNWSDLAGTPLSGAGFMGMGLILNDGSFIRLHGYGDSCTTMNLGVQACGEMIIDTNGYKKPNMVGKDIYGAHFTRNGVMAWGVTPGSGNGVPVGSYGDDANSYSNCSATAVPANGGTERGWACGVKNLLK